MPAAMKASLRELVRLEKGASIIEFAVMAPVLSFLLIGIIEVGRFMYFGVLAANAARAGVQWGAQNLSTADNAAGMTYAAAQDGQNLSNWTITSSYFCTLNGTVTACATSSVPSGEIYYVQVSATGSFYSLFQYPGIPRSVPVSGTAVMRVVSQ
jgi:Flp pilus assembly protein TadG